MKKEELLIERLKEYGKSETYPFHMPGHKRQGQDEILDLFPNPFSIDITEVDGFDNLHHPEDCLKRSMEWAASVYGADRTYYLVNGSSGGILSAISAAVRPGGTILMSRNCHKSVYHGVILNQLKTEYLYPQILTELGIQGPLEAAAVDKALKKNPDIQAVFVVSPTYDGVVSDIRTIAEIAHGYGVPLIVDEAHGAHFSFGETGQGERLFPESAVSCGADVVIQSLHKTLPSLTQTAVLHWRRGYVDEKRLERYLQMYQSSSPSYVFMASMENCIYQMSRDGKQRMEEFGWRLKELRERLSGMKHLRLLVKEPGMKYGSGWDLDLSKIVVSCRGCQRRLEDGSLVSLDGEMLMEWLREQFHLELEMCGADYVVAITTLMDTPEGLKRLADAFLTVDSRLEETGNCRMDGKPWQADETIQKANESILKTEKMAVRPVMSMGEAVNAPSVQKRLESSAGFVSAEFVYLYPPGIPIVAPGELISEETVALVGHYKNLGLPVQGMADPAAEWIQVIERE